MLLLVTGRLGTLHAQGVAPSSVRQADELLEGFRSPPASARPLTWWHWVNSNVTKEGITRDLEWMQRVGIGGFHAFDVAIGAGQTVDDKVVFMTPEWLDAIRHTAAEADRLGLEMTMHTAAGWSETGGPWVEPHQAMKKLVWSETRITGGRRFAGRLPAPPSNSGPIRDLVRVTDGQPGAPDPTFYADVAVLAYRTPAAEGVGPAPRPTVTTSIGTVDATALLDERLSTGVTFPIPTADQPVWIQYEYSEPFTTRAFSLAVGPLGRFGSSIMRTGVVQASDDGASWRTLVALPGAQHDIRTLPVRTFAFPATTARFFRVELYEELGVTTVAGVGPGVLSPPPTTLDVMETVFHAGARVHRWEDKAGFAPNFEFEHLATPEVPAAAVIPRDGVIDLTPRLAPDGTLSWDVPPGNWTVLRMGYSLTGEKNSPAVPAGRGLEKDKLNREHTASYYRSYVGPIADAMGPLFGSAMQFFLIDSYEANAQNWTENMVAEFRRRRGYDPTPYLPALAGRIVGSADVTDRFLYNFRQTLADLLHDEHYLAFRNLARSQGVGLYGEAPGVSLPILADVIRIRGLTDVPMAEFGMRDPTPEMPALYRGASDRQNAIWSDIRDAASAAHIYGRPFVAAEAFTGGGYEPPARLKEIGDYYFTQGINRFVFHTSAHQPLDTKPGNTMVGTHLHRNITWAELAAPYLTYVARSQFLLQQGQFVADIAYFAGEAIPSAVPYWERLTPEAPEGYNFDFLSTEILLDSLSVRDGRLVLPSGMSYRVLVLPNTAQMSERVLRKVRQLIADGASVVGPKPRRSPGLEGYPTADSVVAALAKEIWGDVDGRVVYTRSYGKGHIHWGTPLAGVLASLGATPSFQYTRPRPNTHLTWIHRRAPEADIYFVSNRRDQAERVEVRLRVSGKAPELWNAVTGTVEPAGYRIEDDATFVPLELDPYESVFIVLRQPAAAPQRPAIEHEVSTLATVGGAWNLAFPPNFGAPDRIQLDSLMSWTEHPEPGVKFFSGTAMYTRTLQAGRAWFRPGARLVLDLGDVGDIAEVSVNGQDLGVLWTRPYQVDVTDVLRPGANRLAIRVTNQWTNRLLGDRSLPDEQRVLPEGAAIRLAGLGSVSPGGEPVLLPSGLLRPVRVLSVTTRAGAAVAQP
jgi:hypothetical protein